MCYIIQKLNPEPCDTVYTPFGIGVLSVSCLLRRPSVYNGQYRRIFFFYRSLLLPTNTLLWTSTQNSLNSAELYHWRSWWPYKPQLSFQHQYQLTQKTLLALIVSDRWLRRRLIDWVQSHFNMWFILGHWSRTVSVPESISTLKRTHILKMMYSPKNSTLGHLVSQEERMWFMMKLVYVCVCKWVGTCWGESSAG